jgi:predicted nucleotidyltransferase
MDVNNHVKVSQELNSVVWEPCCDNVKCVYPKHYCIKEEVRRKLLRAAYDFHIFLGVNVDIEDVIFTGSLANFNYTEFSDIDLHLLIDFSTIDADYDFVKEYMNAKKTVWNKKHDIQIKGYDVELYAQDSREAHHSTGVFSILRNEWIHIPTPTKRKIDFHSIMEKSRHLMNYIDHVLSQPNRESNIEKLKEKIRNMRQSGLSSGGEYSVENLTFKVLRNTGYLEKIYDTATSDYDSRLSIKQ